MTAMRLRGSRGKNDILATNKNKTIVIYPMSYNIIYLTKLRKEAIIVIILGIKSG